jgi:ribosome-associated protein
MATAANTDTTQEKKTSRARKEAEPMDPNLALARRVAELMLEKKADNVVLLQVGGLTSFADFFVLGSAQSDRQVQAMGRLLNETLKKEGHPALSREGEEQSHWVLMDFGGVVAHIFYDPARAYYDLDGLWADAPRVELEDTAAQRKAAARHKAASESEGDDDDKTPPAAPKRKTKARAKKANA